MEAIAIYNDLMAHPAKVTATITGMAASAASLICMAADEIAMMPGSKLMIHNAWCFGQGNADYFEGLAHDLRSIDTSMAQAYAARCDKPVDELAVIVACVGAPAASPAKAWSGISGDQAERMRRPLASVRLRARLFEPSPLSIDCTALAEYSRPDGVTKPCWARAAHRPT